MTVKVNKNKIERISIAQAVAREIRRRIIRYEYLPGQRLKESEICKDLNVSNTPVREAFRILQAENMLKVTPYVGVEVIKLTKKDIRNLCDVRRILESRAAELAAKVATEEQRNELKKIIDELNNNDYSNFELVDELEEKYHLYIAKMSDNEELERIIANMYRRTQILRTMILSTKEGINMAREQHNLIAQAIIEQKPEKARKYMENHLETAASHVLMMEDINL